MKSLSKSLSNLFGLQEEIAQFPQLCPTQPLGLQEWPIVSLLGFDLSFQWVLLGTLIFLFSQFVVSLYVHKCFARRLDELSQEISTLSTNTKADFDAFINQLNSQRKEAKIAFLARLAKEFDPFVTGQSNVLEQLNNVSVNTKEGSTSMTSVLKQLENLSTSVEGLTEGIDGLGEEIKDNLEVLRESFEEQFGVVNQRLSFIQSAIENQEEQGRISKELIEMVIRAQQDSTTMSMASSGSASLEKSMWDESFLSAVSAVEGLERFKEPEEEKEKKRKQSREMDKKMIGAYKSILSGLPQGFQEPNLLYQGNSLLRDLEMDEEILKKEYQESFGLNLFSSQDVEGQEGNRSGAGSESEEDHTPELDVISPTHLESERGELVLHRN